jgi:hypothetical protein
VIVIHLARKPLEGGTVAANTLRHGTGGLNVDGCRLFCGDEHARGVVSCRSGGAVQGADLRSGPALGMYEPGRGFVATDHARGRWPANLVLEHRSGCQPVAERKVKGSRIEKPCDSGNLRTDGWGSIQTSRGPRGIGDVEGNETVTVWVCVDGCPVSALDAQAGFRPSTLTGRADPSVGHAHPSVAEHDNRVVFDGLTRPGAQVYADAGGASRFFKQVRGVAP